MTKDRVNSLFGANLSKIQQYISLEFGFMLLLN